MAHRHGHLRQGDLQSGKVVSIASGVLTSTSTPRTAEFLVAALLPKVPGTKRHGQTYGRYRGPFQMDRIEGYKVADAVARQPSLAARW